MTGAKVLESLIARGRRVRNFRESREITFGLADLSTNVENHERLLKKGGVDALVNILTTAQDAEAQQFAALAVANTASSKALCGEIIQLDGVVENLVKYVGNEQADSIGRQMTAMALGNILADPGTHEVVVAAGGIGALMTMLKNCCDAGELEAGKHAAFGISNVASNVQHHQQIVEAGAIELLVALACCEDPDTQRQALGAVRGLCLAAENRHRVLEKGILDPLILMSRSKDVDIVREVSSALNCLSSEEENKEEISYRAISTLISLLMSGDDVIEMHSCCAIANLVEVTEIHTRFLEENGVPPLVTLCSSPDGQCRMEAARAVANLSSNPNLIETLIQEKALGPLVKSIEQDGDNCRFAALAIANFATHAPSLFKIVQAGAIPHLVSLVAGSSNNVEARRYGSLALANMTACEAFHASILSEDGPQALFELASNSNDDVSQHYWGCAIANLSSNAVNHEPIVEMGGLQPIIALAYDKDLRVHKQAAAALRGFSATGNINLKIVQEGGLEPLCRLLLSGDQDVLRETTACFCNLSLADENKFEIAKSGAVPPLIGTMESEDPIVAQYSSECLANLAEMTDNQEFIAREGAVIPCINAMRSRHIEIQRESGRLLANLAASSSKLAADAIVDGGGHDLLISFLLSQDANCQRVGAFGIGNLCTHDHHRRTIMKAGALEPLSSLARSGKIELEIRRFSMLALANLASCFQNHDDFVTQNTVPLLVSFSNSADPEIRNYAAFAVAELSRNSDMISIITNEGGLEPVLYLARSDDIDVQRQVLPALATLSFLDPNKLPIANDGGVETLVSVLTVSERKCNPTESQLACCAIANLVEAASNMPLVVNNGCVPLLIGALESSSESVRREACRAIGNLAVNIDYCNLVIKRGAAKRLVACFRSQNCECQRMAAMALSNLSANMKSHAQLLDNDILDLIKKESRASLDPKRFSDQETARFCLLIVSNLTSRKENHQHMCGFFDILMDFTRHRDIKCRQHAILAMGNLCTNPLHIRRLIDVKCTDALVAFSFPPTAEDSANAQFQAIAGLHGMSKQPELRESLLRNGLEPLILGAQGNNRFSCVEIQRESAATLANLALAKDNRIIIAKSGALPALVNLARTSDSVCQVHSLMALANLAETNGVHELMLDKQCLDPMCQLVAEKSTHVNVLQAVSRCMALLASNAKTHGHLTEASVIEAVQILASTGDTFCERFAVLAVAKMALVTANHKILMEADLVEIILRLLRSEDVETLRGMSFALNSFSLNEKNHAALEKSVAVEALVLLARSGDTDTALQACLAAKNLCVCEDCRNTFVKSRGLEPLLALASSDDLEIKKEVAAALRNISLSDQNKESIMEEGGMDIIAMLCRDADDEVSHQACGVIANIAERQENKVVMIEQGILHHLQFSILSESVPVLRESIRAFANLSSASENTSTIASSGALTHLIKALGSSDTFSRRFAVMTLSNLASNDESKVRIFREGGVPPLMSIIRQTDDRDSQRFALSCLANVAALHDLQAELLESSCLDLAMNYVKSSDLDIRTNALLCLSNFASNSKTHEVLKKHADIVSEVVRNLGCTDRVVQLRSVTAVRGLSTDPAYREEIVKKGGVEPLLTFVHLDDDELKVEVLSTLCNLSLGGCMGDQANALLKRVDMQSLIAFLCNNDSTQRLFGAVAIGNIASHVDLQAPVFDSGALQPLIGLTDQTTSDEVDDESQRCMAYAICNLSAEAPNRMSIILKGGLPSIMYLCRTGDDLDMLAALSTLRGLAASVEARRPIVEEGVFSVLPLAMKTECLKCKREVTSLLVQLSLNEENKFDIVRSDVMTEFVSLTDMDDTKCVSQVCRAFGNISEVSSLHEDILQVFTVQHMIRLTSHSDAVALEVARCYANLACNFDVHELIVNSPQLLAKICALCASEDADVCRFSVLALANLSLKSALKISHLVPVLLQVIKGALPEIEDDGKVQKMVEAKCYACIALGAICEAADVQHQIVELGGVPALLKLLRVSESNTMSHPLEECFSELNLHVTFVFNKLSKANSARKELGDKQVASQLTNHTQETNPHALTHAFAAFRRLSDDVSVRGQLLDSNALEFMAKFADLKNIERCREIASGMCHLTLWDKARAHMMKCDMFGHILELMKSEDVETSRFALGTLANIADDARFHDEVAEKAGVVQTITCIARKNKHIAVVRESSRALSNLFSSAAACATFLKEDGMALLVGISEMEDAECVNNAAVSFRKLAANGISHEAFFDQGGAVAAMNLCARDERNVQIQSAAALRDISSNPNFKLALVKKGVVRTSMELSSIPDVELKTITFGLIRHLSIDMQLKIELVESGIVGIMADCAIEADDGDLLSQVASSIANMAEHASNKVSLVKMGILRCLVTLSGHGSAQVKRESARAFSLLSSAPENHAGVFDNKILPSVLNLLVCHDEETGRDGASTVSNVATGPAINSLIGDLGGIPPLIALLGSPYESCQENASSALCRLATLEANKALIFDHGGLEPLVQLCTSSVREISVVASNALCNLSTCSGYQMKFVEENGIPTLKQLLSSDNTSLRKIATMILCNLTCDVDVQDHVARQVDPSQLFELMNDASVECRAFAVMTICNLATKERHATAIIDARGLEHLATMVETADGTNLQRAALLAFYNLSTCENSHELFVKNNVVPPIIAACRGPDVLCRRFSLMVLANISCNDETRADATKGGGLQAAVLSLNDDDFTSRRFACVCLANMGINPNTQSQIVVHGGLPSLVSLCLVDDDETQEAAFMCLSNIAGNESNHSALFKKGAFKAFVKAASSRDDVETMMTSTFAIANLTSNSEILSQIGKGGGIKPLISLAKSENLHARCLALSSLRRLALVRENRDKLMDKGIITTLVNACHTAEQEIQRESASCFVNLSLSPSSRLAIARAAVPELVALIQSDDFDAVRLSLGTMANLAEEIETHRFMMKSSSVINSVVSCMGRAEIDIKREACRAVSNMLTSVDVHTEIVARGLDSLVELSLVQDDECRGYASLSFAKLCVVTTAMDPKSVRKIVPACLSLVQDGSIATRTHAATALRDLSATGKDDEIFFLLKAPTAMVELVRGSDKELQAVAVTTLRHLSKNDFIEEDFSTSGIVESVIRCVAWANEEFRCQIAGLFANLSEHRECQSTLVSNGIVEAIDALMDIERDDIWQDCARTLAHLCANEGKQGSIQKQGGLNSLSKLSKSRMEVTQRYAAIGIRFMSSSVEVQRLLADGTEAFPFLEFSGSDLLDFQRSAAAAFASMSLNETGKLLLLRKGSIKPALDLCIHLDLTVRRDAVYCIANLASSPDFRQFVVKEGGVKTIKAAATSNQNIELLRDAARAMSSFSVDTATKEIMIGQEVPKVLCRLAKSPDSATQRCAALALCNLCLGTREQKELVTKQGVLSVLLFLLRFPDLEVERCASLAIAALSLGSDRNKVEVIDNGFVRPLIETTTYPDTRMRQCALLALNGLVLGESLEPKECMYREDGLPPLLALLRSEDDETVHAGLYMIGALAENKEIRDALVAMDCLQLVIENASVGSIEIKRAAAYFLSLMSECPEYHNMIEKLGGLESIVALASLVDEECQDCGAFTLAYLANNPSFQVPLTKLGSVRPLVSMMAMNSEAKHYAATALLKLADNFDNHVSIAEEGGINALLTLGKSKVASDNLQYKSALAVGAMAKNAINQSGN